MQVSTYSAAAVNVIYAGHLMTGFGEGDSVIEVARTKDSIQMTTGIKGDGVLSQSTDKSGKIKIKLLAGSATNKFLSDKANASDAGSLFSGDITISETGTDAGVIAEKCVIVKVPDFTRGAVAQELEWEFYSQNINIKHSSGTEL